jgi:hypothetical protein
MLWSYSCWSIFSWKKLTSKWFIYRESGYHTRLPISNLQSSFILSFLLSRSLKMSNQLHNQIADFVADFNDHPGFADVANTITHLLTTGLTASVDSPNNPINTYARDEDADVIMARLREHVHATLNDNQHANLLVAFFHQGGVYYDMLNELMDTYWDYADELRDTAQNNQNNQNNQDNLNNNNNRYQD